MPVPSSTSPSASPGASASGDAAPGVASSGVAVAVRPEPDGRHLAALRATGLVASPRSPSLDRITAIVQRATGAPVALFSLIEEDRSIFASQQGVEAAIGAPVAEVPLTLSLCKHVVASEQPLRLDDTHADATTCVNEAVTTLGVGAYLGVPVRTPEGVVIGSLCAIDFAPRAWTDADEATLHDLAHLVTDEIALRQEVEARILSAARASASDARYRRLLESIHDAFFSLDADWRVTYVNAAAERILGHPRARLLGAEIWDFYPAAEPFHEAPFHDACVKAAETRTPVSFESYYAPLDVHIAVRLYPFEGGLSVYFRDVSVRVAAEAAERAATATAAAALAQLEVVLDTLGEGLILADPDGTLARWNPSALALHGYESEDALHVPLADLDPLFRIAPIGGAPLPVGEWPLARAVRGERFSDMEIEVSRADQPWRRILAYSGALARSADGEPISAVMTMRDVTEAHAARAALQQLNETLEARVAERTEEIAHASERLAHTNTLLIARNRELQDFAHVASHDLQEPLRKMRAFADILVLEHSAGLDAEARGFLDKVQSGAERMSRLLSDLLAFSRVTSHGRPYETIDLGETADRVISDLSLRIDETGGEVTIDGPLPSVTGDASQLYQLILNLVQNALKFHADGVAPRVVLSGEAVTEGAREVVRLRVRDEGIGFEAKYRDRIFKPFQRLHGRGGGFEGTGMGLAICRRIVDRHGGRIEVESAPGEGTTFTVTLPVTPPAPQTYDGDESENGA